MTDIRSLEGKCIELHGWGECAVIIELWEYQYVRIYTTEQFLSNLTENVLYKQVWVSYCINEYGQPKLVELHLIESHD